MPVDGVKFGECLGIRNREEVFFRESPNGQAFVISSAVVFLRHDVTDEESVKEMPQCAIRSCSSMCHSRQHHCGKNHARSVQEQSCYQIINLHGYPRDIFAFSSGHPLVLHGHYVGRLFAQWLRTAVVPALESLSDVLRTQIKRGANGEEGKRPLGVIAKQPRLGLLA